MPLMVLVRGLPGSDFGRTLDLLTQHFAASSAVVPTVIDNQDFLPTVPILSKCGSRALYTRNEIVQGDLYCQQKVCAALAARPALLFVVNSALHAGHLRPYVDHGIQAGYTVRLCESIGTTPRPSLDVLVQQVPTMAVPVLRRILKIFASIDSVMRYIGDGVVRLSLDSLMPGTAIEAVVVLENAGFPCSAAMMDRVLHLSLSLPGGIPEETQWSSMRREWIARPELQLVRMRYRRLRLWRQRLGQLRLSSSGRKTAACVLEKIIDGLESIMEATCQPTGADAERDCPIASADVAV